MREKGTQVLGLCIVQSVSRDNPKSAGSDIDMFRRHEEHFIAAIIIETDFIVLPTGIDYLLFIFRSS